MRGSDAPFVTPPSGTKVTAASICHNFMWSLYLEIKHQISEIPIAMIAMSAATFPLFSSLPIELQSVVWEHAAAHETFRHINAFSVSMTELRHAIKKDGLPSLYAYLQRMCNKGDTRHLLATCALARTTVLRSWRTRLAEDLPTSGKGWYSNGAPSRKVQGNLVDEVEEVIRGMVGRRN